MFLACVEMHSNGQGKMSLCAVHVCTCGSKLTIDKLLCLIVKFLLIRVHVSTVSWKKVILIELLLQCTIELCKITH